MQMAEGLTTTMLEPRTKGRQTNTPKIPQVAHHPLTRCPTCGSTKRENYHRVTSQEGGGERDGVPYDRIVWRRTQCSDCGQHRIDRCYE